MIGINIDNAAYFFYSFLVIMWDSAVKAVLRATDPIISNNYPKTKDK